MAKKRIFEGSHLSYCAGKDWQGDGSADTSPCPFKHSKYIDAKRYICHYCATGIKPSDIIADSYGIHKTFFTT